MILLLFKGFQWTRYAHIMSSGKQMWEMVVKFPVDNTHTYDVQWNYDLKNILITIQLFCKNFYSKLYILLIT